MRHFKEQHLSRRRAYLQGFNQLTTEQQRVHLVLILTKIVDRLCRAKIDQPGGGLPTKQLF